VALQSKIHGPGVEFLENVSERLEVPVMDRQTEHGRAGMADDDPGDVEQTVAKLFHPPYAPTRFPMNDLEDLDEVVGQKLELEKDGGGQGPDSQTQPDLGQDLNVPPTKFMGQVGHRVRPRNARHLHKIQQAWVGFQKIKIRQSVAAFDDHRQKRQDLSRHRIASLPLFEMREFPLKFLPQTDILSEGHEQSEPRGSGGLGPMKGAEFEISDSLGYHPDAFLESHLQGDISGFLGRLYFIQFAGKIEAFFCLKKNITLLSEYWGSYH